MGVYILISTLAQSNYPWIAIFWLAILFMVFSVVSLYVRRLHDINLPSGTIVIFLLARFVPFASYALLALVFFLPGTKGENKYGESEDKRPFLRTLLNQ